MTGPSAVFLIDACALRVGWRGWCDPLGPTHRGLAQRCGNERLSAVTGAVLLVLAVGMGTTVVRIATCCPSST